MHGPKIVLMLLALMFKGMLTHGFMLVGSVVPIPKGHDTITLYILQY